MAIQELSFSDPQMAQELRQNEYQVSTGVADLQLEAQRLVEDDNLFRPYLKRRFANQADKAAGAVAGRGFHGSNSGIMRDTMSDLAEDQAYAAGQYERQSSRRLTDIERAIANLTGQGIMGGAESVRGGGGRLADELVRMF